MQRPVSQERPQKEVLAADPDRDAELAQLRAEVNSLRMQLGQEKAKPSRATGDIRGQLQEQMEALRSDLGQIAQAPLAARQGGHVSFAPEVAALHGRLTAIRSEVARVLQEFHHGEDASSPNLQAQLGALLAELSDVRSSAANVAAVATAANWGTGCMQSEAGRSPWPGMATSKPLPVAHARPENFVHQAEPVATGAGLWDVPTRHLNDERFVDMPLSSHRRDLPSRDVQLHDVQPQTQPQPVADLSASPLMVCQHLAAELGLGYTTHGIAGPTAAYGYGGPEAATQHLSYYQQLQPPLQRATASRPTRTDWPEAHHASGAATPVEARLPEEPGDRAPQGLIRRPSRSKLVGYEAAVGEPPPLPGYQFQPVF